MIGEWCPKSEENRWVWSMLISLKGSIRKIVSLTSDLPSYEASKAVEKKLRISILLKPQNWVRKWIIDSIK